MQLRAIDAWLSATPLALVALVLFTAVALAGAAGHMFSRVHGKAGSGETETFIVSSVFGLLALLLGFTFALTIDRFEVRRVLVQEEANAIGAAYLRTQLLDEPHRSRISEILLQYTENRIALARVRPNQNRELLAANDRLIGEFWSASAAAFPSIRQYDFSSAFLESVNRVINLEATRKSARLARVPTEVFALLIVYVVASAGVLGAVVRGVRALTMSGMLLALLSLSLVLILDIDRPSLGGVRETQGPMERLLPTMTLHRAP
jgi:hypothetical protein